MADYEAVYPQLIEQVGRRLAELAPAGADGAAVVNAVADRIREEFLTRIGLEDVLHPHAPALQSC